MIQDLIRHTWLLEIVGDTIRVKAQDVAFGDIALVDNVDGETSIARVVELDRDIVSLQVFAGGKGLSTEAGVRFLGHPLRVTYSDNILGRIFRGSGEPIDGGPALDAESKINTGGPAVNPMMRVMPTKMIQTHVPMIDLFNCLVESQKIPIFSLAGEPYNELLARIGFQADADVVVFGGLGLIFDDFHFFRTAFEEHGVYHRTVMFVNQAIDPIVERLQVPDMALAVAERLAVEENQRVLVLLTDMTNFADALKEIAITMEQVPSNRGYPGDLYSQLAARYEKAVDFEGAGSVTVLAATIMPGDDVTHPVPDNTGYITEGQVILSRSLYRKKVSPPIDVQQSLSRLKDKGIGKGKTREDHADLFNQLIACYARGKEAAELSVILGEAALSDLDKIYLKFSQDFEEQYISQGGSEARSIDETLDLGWELLRAVPRGEMRRVRDAYLEKYYDAAEVK